MGSADPDARASIDCRGKVSNDLEHDCLSECANDPLIRTDSPIVCPKMANPSDEEVDRYHNLYLQATQRIYEQYKNTYNWHQPDRPLVLK
jgi:hypothetical protein